MKRELTWEEFPFPEADLRRAARVAGQALPDALPQPEDCGHSFSPKFRQNMDRLVRRVDRSGWSTGFQRVACFFLGLLLSGTAWLTVDAQAREKVFGWVSQQLENTRHYFFVEEEKVLPEKGPDISYVLPAVPEGYRLEDTGAAGTHRDWLYVNEKGQYLTFGYLTKERKYATSHIFFSTDGSEKKTVLVRSMPAEYYYDPMGKESSLLVWRDAERDTLLYISAYLAENDLIRLAETVVREEK